MSVDAHELERGALKRKDREQLLTIASALGKKPPARARKDQIIDLILGLGDGSESSAAAGGNAQQPGTAAAEPLPFEPSDQPSSTPAAADAPPPVASSGAAGPAAAATPASPAATPASPAATPASPPAATPAPNAAPASTSAPVTRPGHVAPAARPATFSPFDDMDAPAFRRTPPQPAERPDQDGLDRGADGETSGARNGESADRDSAAQHRSSTASRPAVSGNGDAERERGDQDNAERDGDDDFGDRADGERGDGQSEREGGGRRRRRRGRDKDRDRADRPAPTGQGQPAQAQGGEQPARPEREVNREQVRDRDQVRDREPNRDRERSDEHGGPASGGNDLVPVAGHLDLRDEGYGFLRVKGYLPSKEDVYVPAKFVRQYALRKGDYLSGSSRPAGRGEKNPALLRIDAVNSADPERSRNRRRFEELTPLFPDEQLKLERPGDPTNMTSRIIDLISPIGKGQRGLIVSPPKAGKTTIMKTIAQAIEANNPEVKLIVLLIDERPEEVTDMRRSVSGEVVASTFDRPADEHTHVVEMTIERAKRMVENGEDVVIILDGITRLARAYNLAAPATGRIMSGGIDTGALYPPKKFFGAARNVEEGGSLTILATALVETGSRMDEVIFEEFKGTGNMELRLDRKLAEKRIYPAIDVDASSTRHEELLFDRRQLNLVWKLRRVLSGLAGDGAAGAGLELLVDRMRTFKSNDEFLAEVAKAPSM